MFHPCAEYLSGAVAGLLLAAGVSADVIHVDASRPYGGDGSSWRSAMRYLNDALAVAGSADEIWVASGTYYPDRRGADPFGSGDRDDSFSISGLRLYGGFLGVETQRAQRNWVRNETILSGDIGTPGSSGDNSRHVVRGSFGSGRLDGFTIQDGNANGTSGYPVYDDRGGAVLFAEVVQNCVIRNNYGYQVGGLCEVERVVNCRFFYNAHTQLASAAGNFETNNEAYINCVFLEDESLGAFEEYDTDGRVDVLNCTFVEATLELIADCEHAVGGCGSAVLNAYVRNCAFSDGAYIYTFEYGDGAAVTAYIDYSAVDFVGGDGAAVWGAGNHVGPALVDSTGRARIDSPCIDAGSNLLLPPDETDLDEDGDLGETLPIDAAGAPRRIDDPRRSDAGAGSAPLVDMGACEREPILFVDLDATGGADDGTSWQDAFLHLQDALATATAGYEIWVAAGTYRPDVGAGFTPGDRAATFTLPAGVAVYGGFAGTETERSQRDWTAHGSVLSGDLLGDDDPPPGSRTDNSYHVVTTTYSGSGRVLDGFTIRGGNANTYGGGLYANRGTFRHCTFSDNRALDGTFQRGGAVWISMGGLNRPTFIDCAFTGNLAAYGGAVYVQLPDLTDPSSYVRFINCRFAENFAVWGGAVQIAQPTSLRSNEVSFTNCVFVDNSASAWGGAINAQRSTGLALANCTLRRNSASSGGGLGLYGTAEIHNSIFFENTGSGSAIALDSSDLTVASSNVQGGFGQVYDLGGSTVDWHATNIDADPQFDPGSDHLLTFASPCIDAGDNAALPWDYVDLDQDGVTFEVLPLDFDGRARRSDVLAVGDTGLGTSPIVDMGAAERRGASVLYVDAAAPEDGDGRSWASAFRFLRDAIEIAQSGDEIRIAGGTYYPDADHAIPLGTLLRYASFDLIGGLTLRGGYAGSTSGTPDQRCLDTCPTVLTGDLLGDDGPGFTGNGENSYHVVTVYNAGEVVLLDGLQVVAGNADGAQDAAGGGLFVYRSDVQLVDCRLAGNQAIADGGGLNAYEATPAPSIEMTRCDVVGNASQRGGGAFIGRGPARFTDCLFEDNSADSGGGLYLDVYADEAVLSGCTLRGNQATSGGGLTNQSSASMSADTCIFEDNLASGYGGVLGCSGDTTSTFRNSIVRGNIADIGGVLSGASAHATRWENCTLVGNSAAQGGALYTSTGSLEVSNSILWGNVATIGYGSQIHLVSAADAQVHHSCVEGSQYDIAREGGSTLTWGVGNRHADPLLVDPGAGDLHLTSQSPCINAGDPNGVYVGQHDIDDEARVLHGRVDIGADEATSFSDCDGSFLPDWQDILFGSPDCNGNGVPDICDVTAGTSNDCNGDGVPDECELALTEFDGRVVVEAEDVVARTPPVGSRNEWLLVPDEHPGAGSFLAIRGRVLQAFPDTRGNVPREGGTARYPLRIYTPGEYQLYLRGAGYDLGSDSSYAWIAELSDGTGGVIADWYRFNRRTNDLDNTWMHEGGFERTDHGGNDVPAVWSIDAPGVYTLEFSAREGGWAFDTFVLQLSSLPEPVVEGPPAPLAYSLDCNHNQVPDLCDITTGVSSDADGNGIPDECDDGVCGTPCDVPGGDADLNDDCLVDLGDLATILANFGRTGVNHAEGDTDGDRVVGLNDLANVLGAFGRACPP